MRFSYIKYFLLKQTTLTSHLVFFYNRSINEKISSPPSSILFQGYSRKNVKNIALVRHLFDIINLALLSVQEKHFTNGNYKKYI